MIILKRELMSDPLMTGASLSLTCEEIQTSDTTEAQLILTCEGTEPSDTA